MMSGRDNTLTQLLRGRGTIPDAPKLNQGRGIPGRDVAPVTNLQNARALETTKNLGVKTPPQNLLQTLFNKGQQGNQQTNNQVADEIYMDMPNSNNIPEPKKILGMNQTTAIIVIAVVVVVIIAIVAFVLKRKKK